MSKANFSFFSQLEPLREVHAFAQYLAPARQGEWVVYAKRPFAGPEQVLDYVGRYTHRVAISNNRLQNIDDGKIQFHWKDYRHHDRQKIRMLEADEFIRRFLLHTLPQGFQRIRYYGLLGNRYRGDNLALCRQLMSAPPPATLPNESIGYRDRYEPLTGVSLRLCPACGQGHMVRIKTLPTTPRIPAPLDTS